jgi:hypothetical protein
MALPSISKGKGNGKGKGKSKIHLRKSHEGPERE